MYINSKYKIMLKTAKKSYCLYGIMCYISIRLNELVCNYTDQIKGWTMNKHVIFLSILMAILTIVIIKISIDTSNWEKWNAEQIEKFENLESRPGFGLDPEDMLTWKR